jgi:hypothetical protein
MFNVPFFSRPSGWVIIMIFVAFAIGNVRSVVVLRHYLFDLSEAWLNVEWRHYRSDKCIYFRSKFLLLALL